MGAGKVVGGAWGGFAVEIFPWDDCLVVLVRDPDPLLTRPRRLFSTSRLCRGGGPLP